VCATGKCRASSQKWLLGVLFAAEVVEDALVKLVHVFALPCVTRRVLAPSATLLLLQCTAMILFAAAGFESAGLFIHLTHEERLTEVSSGNATGFD